MLAILRSSTAKNTHVSYDKLSFFDCIHLDIRAIAMLCVYQFKPMLFFQVLLDLYGFLTVFLAIERASFASFWVSVLSVVLGSSYLVLERVPGTVLSFFAGICLSRIRRSLAVALSLRYLASKQASAFPSVLWCVAGIRRRSCR